MVVPPRGTTLPRVAALFGLLAVAVMDGNAQTLPTGGLTPAQAAAAAAGQSPVVSSPRVLTRPTGLALEGPVDADEYVVGPGDVFTVSVGGSTARQYSVSVSADGRVAVPEAGSFPAAGRSLARVRADVQAGVQRRYLNVPVDVSLATPREFFVHVSGALPEPGRHLVPAVARVSQAVEAASGRGLSDLATYDEPATTIDVRWPALRNVTVESRTSGDRRVDLVRYLATGDLRANPYLSDGDRIHIPSFSPLTDGVIVGGAVDRPGTYDVRPGDTARDLIEATSGLTAGSRIARVRRVSLGRPVVEVPFADAASMTISPGDHLYAVPTNAEAALARVDGAVRYPGFYPIVQGQTTVGELVRMAGGLRDDALARGAYLERAAQLLETGTARAETEEATLPDVSVDADLLQGLFGRQFYARQTAATPRVSMTPEAALAGDQAVPLYRDDRLVVPFDYGLVRVYGRVERSGYVPFVEGSTASDYVAQAGGRTATGAAVYVIDAATGQLAEGENSTVRRGDAVFVNSLPTPDTPAFADLALQERRDQREDARDRRQARFQFVQTVLGVAGTVASLIIAYVTVQSLNSSSN